MKALSVNIHVIVHFNSGRDAEGTVVEWSEDAVLRSLDGKVLFFIPKVLSSVESVEIVDDIQPPVVTAPLQRTVDTISQQYSKERYRNPFIR